MGRAFGIAATNDLDSVGAIAAEVEQLGYSSLWTNDTPAADGIAVASAVQRATANLRVGIGVMPVDRRPIDQIAGALEALNPASAVIGIGAGFSPEPIADTVAAVAELREARPEFRIAVAAMGPRMCRAAGEAADVVLFNWMTPERVAWAIERCAEGMKRRSSDLKPLETATYVRGAIGSDAATTISAEAQRYSTMPHYSRHFDAMGAGFGSLGVALNGKAETALRLFEELLDETVVRALPGSPDDVDEILAIARAAAP